MPLPSITTTFHSGPAPRVFPAASDPDVPKLREADTLVLGTGREDELPPEGPPIPAPASTTEDPRKAGGQSMWHKLKNAVGRQ